jgi:hypothetical protein
MGQPRVDAGEWGTGDGRSANLLAPLEDRDRSAGAREQRGGDKPVVAAADHHGIEPARLRHRQILAEKHVEVGEASSP